MEMLNGLFEDDSQYFSQAIEFLTRFEWLFRYPNTDILIHDILMKIPHEWIAILNLNQPLNTRKALSGEFDSSWPVDLLEFLLQSRNLSLRSTDYKELVNYDPLKEAKKWKKTNPKKVHEVVNFSRIIQRHCEENKIRHVIDVGAGLGYLDKELSEACNLQVLGLERDAYRVSQANQRSQSGATFKELCVTDVAFEIQVESVVNEWLNELEEDESSPLCLIGLHSCGDLSPVMMKLFLNIPRFRSLLLVSCCYHRMQLVADDPTKDDNFPLSDKLKGVFNIDWKESIPFLLRLAAQETTNQWLHDSSTGNNQSRHTFYRAVLQLYANNEGIQLDKKARKAVKMESNLFEDYINQAVHRFGLKDDAEIHLNKLREIYQTKEHLMKSVETFNIIQALLQPVAEAFILVDRILFFRENCIDNASLQQIFDDRISPRCFVTIAHKKDAQNSQ